MNPNIRLHDLGKRAGAAAPALRRDAVKSLAMDWPHSPVHRLAAAGAYMVTAGTYGKVPIFNSARRLDFLERCLLEAAQRYGWNLQAWAIFPNHYHYIALSPERPETLRNLTRHFHATTAVAANRRDQTPSRKVWFEYWDALIRNHKSYLARSSYVHHNAVHHGLVHVPSQYPWCSAAWLERRASRSYFRTVESFPHERIKVPDNFTIEPFQFDT